MCFCEEFFFTINRADNLMIAKKYEDGESIEPIEELGMDVVWELIKNAAEEEKISPILSSSGKFRYWYFKEGEVE